MQREPASAGVGDARGQQVELPFQVGEQQIGAGAVRHMQIERLGGMAVRGGQLRGRVAEFVKLSAGRLITFLTRRLIWGPPGLISLALKWLMDI